MKNILCIILHYGNKNYTYECLDSLNNCDMDIVVIDNDPTQNFYDNIENNYKVIRTGGNLSFSESNNIAVKHFLKEDHDSILFLNNDLTIDRKSIELLYKTLKMSNVGIVGPKINYYDSENIWACGGKINFLRLRINGIKEVKNIDEFYKVDYLPGAAIIIDKIAWNKIGGFSEKYFLTFEEAELSLKIRKIGLKVLVNSHSIAFHRVGMSSGKSYQYVYINVRSRIKFSKFLFGNLFGFLYGIIITTDVFYRNRNNIFIYLNSIIDEFRLVSFNSERLNYIKFKYIIKK